jgi:hypothetical protein
MLWQGETAGTVKMFRRLFVRRPALKFDKRLEMEGIVPFIKVPGLSGRIYVPEPCSAASKKHPCRDCFDCQQCGDDRCSLCRSETMAAAGRGCDRGKPMRDGKGKNAVACGEVKCC